MRTSKTDPIRVDFLTQDACRLPGRIGLTLAPGKKDSRGSWDRDLAEDVRRLGEAYATSLLVCLLEDPELALLGINDYWAHTREQGVRTVQLPIPDGGVPSDVDMIVRLVRAILAVAGVGDTVVIHCRGGLGRSGLLAACCLVALGHAPREAVRIVRQVRPNAVETREQERFAATFERAWTAAPAIVPSASRLVGCLLGGALGDALGYPVEFLRTASEIAHVLGPVTPERMPRAQGGKALVSDDTQMTLFTAEGLIRAHHRATDRGICSTETVLLRAYQRWLCTQTGAGAEGWSDGSERGWLLDVAELRAERAPGRTCLGALEQSLKAGRLPSVDAPPNDSKGCGAVMRSAPIGLVAADAGRAFDMARDAAVLTHGHPSGYLSAAYFAAVIHGVARDVRLVDAMREADALVGEERGADEVCRAVDAARAAAAEGAPTRETLERLGGGWVGEEALAISLACALSVADGRPASLADCLWRAVAHGGDSDSTGSLAGNLLGAMFGAESLPASWVADVELRDTIERIALDLHATFMLDVVPNVRRYPPS